MSQSTEISSSDGMPLSATAAISQPTDISFADGHPLSATAMLQPTGISPSDAIPLSAAMLTGVGDPLAWQLIDEAFRFKPRPEYPEIGQYYVSTNASANASKVNADLK